MKKKKRDFKKIFRDWWKDFTQPFSNSSWRSWRSVSRPKKYEPTWSLIASGKQEGTGIAELVKVCRWTLGRRCRINQSPWAKCEKSQDRWAMISQSFWRSALISAVNNSKVISCHLASWSPLECNDKWTWKAPSWTAIGLCIFCKCGNDLQRRQN